MFVANFSPMINASYSVVLLMALYLICTAYLIVILLDPLRIIPAPDPRTPEAPSMYNFHSGYDGVAMSFVVIS